MSMHFDHNEATRRINESLGFQQQGHLTEIAVVQGQRRGLVISALRTPPTSGSPRASGIGDKAEADWAAIHGGGSGIGGSVSTGSQGCRAACSYLTRSARG